MPKPTYTWEDLSEINKKGQCLLAIRGGVYDVSSFMDRHPGGKEQLMLGSGRDVTQVFESYHKKETQNTFIKQFYVGELVSNELPTFPAASKFQEVLSTRVFGYFKETNQDPKVAPWMWVRYALIVLSVFLGFAMQLMYVNDSIIFTAVGTLILGVACAMVGLMPMHDASHFSITHDSKVWAKLGMVHDFLNGASHIVWAYQHMLGHHAYTNIDEADPDIMTSAADIPDIRRIKDTQSWFPRYIKQHVYAPILYCLLSIKTRVQDPLIMYVYKRNGAIRVNPLTSEQATIFWGGKAFFVAYRILLPLLFISFKQTIVLLLLSDFISAWYLALAFQASHVVSEVEFPKPDEDGKIHQDWSEMQIATTMDYATDSWFWTIATGALNHQTTHHLFPGINQYYYREITPIVVETCKEFNIQYNYKATFQEAIGAHFNHLYRLGQEPVKKAK